MDHLINLFTSPDAGQLSISQATDPAFVLGAVAGFVSILLGRMTAVMDRIRHLNDIAEDEEARRHLKSDIPRLRRRLKLLNGAARLALASGVCTNEHFPWLKHAGRGGACVGGDSEMRLGTLVTGVGGQTQLLVDLAVVVGFALAVFAIAFLLGFLCGRTRRRR
jgi:hypothetical protein